MNRKVRLLITGMSPRDVEFTDGDTLADLIARNDGSLPLSRIANFYVNGTPQTDPSSVVLRPGMLIQGAPKLEGGN